jgi:predicted SnoaL-like aldol condensation-catalyzing enzyme
MITSTDRSSTLTSCTRRTAIRLGSGGLASALALSGIGSTRAQEHSTLNANKALVHRVFEEIINGGNTAVIAELYAPVFSNPTRAVRHFPRLAGLPIPLDEFRSVLPNIVATIEDVIAEGDLVATRVTWRNYDPPAGTYIVGHTMHLSRIVNGQIVEEWSVGWEWLDHLIRFLPRPNPLLIP